MARSFFAAVLAALFLAGLFAGSGSARAQAPPVTSYSAPWNPIGQTATLSVSTTSSRVQLGWAAVVPLPSPAPTSAWVCNTGTTNDAYVVLGNSVAVATTAGFDVRPGVCNMLSINGAQYLAAITASSTTTLVISTGSGSPFAQGVGSGGGALTCSGCSAGNVVGYDGTNLVPTPLTFSGTTTTQTGTFVLSDGTHTVNLQVGSASSNLLDQYNGTAAQRSQINGGRTDAADQAYVFVDAGQAAANTVEIGSTHAGTAPNGNLTKLEFLVDGTNELDYGVTHANVWTSVHNLWFPSSAGIVFGSTGNGTVFASFGDGIFQFSSLSVTEGIELVLGGNTTSSFPMIKRNGTAINFRLADDSGDAAVTAANMQFSAAAPTVSTGQIGFGGTVTATGNCGSLAGDTGCIVVNVAGTTRYIPYY